MNPLMKKTWRNLPVALTLLTLVGAHAVAADLTISNEAALVFPTGQKVGTESAPQNVTLTAALGDVTIKAIGIESPDFVLESVSCGNKVIGVPPTPCDLSVKFTPVTAGIRYAELVIHPDDGSVAGGAQPTYTVYLQGTAIGKTTQTITFGAAPTITVGTTGAVSATASSGLAVTYSSSTPSVCTISGTTVTGVAAGPCVIAADQAGNSDWYPATQTQPITIGMGNQTISFTPVTSTTIAVGGTGVASATASPSGLPVTLTSTTPATCSISGNAVSALAAGTCTIAANQAGNANYNAALQVTTDITINTKTSQTITFGTAPTVNVGTTGTVSATASSGLAVTYGSSTPGICTISGSTVTGVAQGSCTITADQAGNATYNAAPQVTQSFTVGAAPADLCSQYGLTQNTELPLSGNTSKTLSIKTTQGYSFSFTTGANGETGQRRTNYSSSGAVQYVTVSKNKCDFAATLEPFCAKQGGTPLVYTKVGGTGTYQCILEPNTTYYFNVRDASRDATTKVFTNTCAGTCTFQTY